MNPLLASLELFLVSLEAVAFFLPPVRYLLSFSAFASANRMNKVWWGWSTAVRSISWKNMILLIASFYSLLAEVSHDKRIMIGKRNTSAGLRCVFYHEYLSSTTNNVRNNLQNRVLRDNNCTPKKIPACNLNRARAFHIKRNRFWKPGSFDHKCGRRLRERKRRDRQRSLYFLSF